MKRFGWMLAAIALSACGEQFVAGADDSAVSADDTSLGGSGEQPTSSAGGSRTSGGASSASGGRAPGAGGSASASGGVTSSGGEPSSGGVPGSGGAVGSGGSSAETDSDGDGVSDGEDVCPGYDDNQDLNGNQQADECEPGWCRENGNPDKLLCTFTGGYHENYCTMSWVLLTPPGRCVACANKYFDCNGDGADGCEVHKPTGPHPCPPASN